MIYDRHPELQNKWNMAFWARGYYVAAVGNVTEEAIKKYIQEQYEESAAALYVLIDVWNRTQAGSPYVFPSRMRWSASASKTKNDFVLYLDNSRSGHDRV